MDTLHTTSTSASTMDVDQIVVRETSTTRLLFMPSWASDSHNPLRGGFIFQRKSPKGSWEDFDSKLLSTFKMDEQYKLNLTGDDMAKLFSELEKIKDVLEMNGHQYGDQIINLSEENSEGIFLQIGDGENRDWVVAKLKELENDNFENLGAAIGSARLENVIEEFENNIDNSEEGYWQDFFGNNIWILQQLFVFPVVYLNGETYLGGKNSRGRQGSGGSATDFLAMHGSSGSFAVVEIKTPECPLVAGNYRGVQGSGDENEVYKISGDLTGGIVQMENQIFIATEYFSTTIGRDYDNINQLNPTGILIAGQYSEMSETEQKSFDLFRKSLSKNQVLTFDEVLGKLKLLRLIYEQ